jgi:hypothetical protein
MKPEELLNEAKSLYLDSINNPFPWYDLIKIKGKDLAPDIIDQIIKDFDAFAFPYRKLVEEDYKSIPEKNLHYL